MSWRRDSRKCWGPWSDKNNVVGKKKNDAGKKKEPEEQRFREEKEVEGQQHREVKETEVNNDAEYKFQSWQFSIHIQDIEILSK